MLVARIRSGVKIASYFFVFAAGSVAAAAFVFISQSDGVSDTPLPLNQSSEPALTETAATSPLHDSAESETHDSSPHSGEGFPQSGDSAGVTSISDITRNTTVSLTGVVQRVTDEDEFVLSDETGSVTVWTGQSFFVVEQGETVTVNGFIDDDLIVEVYAQEIVGSDGSVRPIVMESPRD